MVAVLIRDGVEVHLGIVAHNVGPQCLCDLGRLAPTLKTGKGLRCASFPSKQSSSPSM